MSKFRFVFGKKYVILKHYDTLFTKSCDGEPFFLVNFFCTYATKNRFFCHNILFLFKKLHHILRENCVRSPCSDIKS
jgi:hypothetical protein